MKKISRRAKIVLLAGYVLAAGILTVGTASTAFAERGGVLGIDWEP